MLICVSVIIDVLFFVLWGCRYCVWLDCNGVENKNIWIKFYVVKYNFSYDMFGSDDCDWECIVYSWFIVL